MAFECDPATADTEFHLSKVKYKAITGREQKREKNVLYYHQRQAFPPGEVDAETALQISYETAMRWTKGKHAFFVVSHIDRPHPHCHIYYNSTTIDCTRKFRDFSVRRGRSGVCLTVCAWKRASPSLNTRSRKARESLSTTASGKRPTAASLKFAHFLFAYEEIT